MGSGRKKIPMKKIENIRNRRVTFSKRRKGLFKKAAGLSLLTGCKFAVLTLSSANNAFFHGDAQLFNQAAAARFFPENFVGIKLKEEAAGLGSFSEVHGDVFCTKYEFEELDDVADNDNAGCSVQVGNCTTPPNKEAGLGKECDDKGFLFTVDEMEELMFVNIDQGEGNGNDTDTADVGADNAVAAWACGMDASSSDIMKMTPWKNTNCYNDSPFQLVPCRSMSDSYLLEGFSSANCYTDKCMEMVQYGMGGDPGTTGLRLTVISEEEELDQRKESLEAFKEQMREQYGLACEAGEIFEQCPLIYFQQH